MKYYLSSIFEGSFEDADAKVTHELKKESFHVLTKINARETLMKKYVNFKNYRILGVCNPYFSGKLLQKDNIETMLSCNVILDEQREGTVEVTVVGSLGSVHTIDNKKFITISENGRDLLKKVIENL